MKLLIFVFILILFACRQEFSESSRIQQCDSSLLKNNSSNNKANYLSDTLKLIIMKKFKLKQVDVLASFTNNQGLDIFILEGDKWEDTYHEWNMYIVPNILNIDTMNLGKYSLPGRKYDYLDTLIYEARVFYGNCVDEYPCSILWYQKTLMEKSKKWEIDYYILDVSSENFKSYRINKNKIDFNEILENLSSKKCFEITGQDIGSEP